MERPIFDWTEVPVQNMFRRAVPLDEEADKQFSDLLNKKAASLTPPEQELQSHRQFYDKVFKCLQGLCSSEYEELTTQDVIMIGNFLKGTESVRDMVAEIVVAFSVLPNSEHLTKVVDRLVDVYNNPPKTSQKDVEQTSSDAKQMETDLTSSGGSEDTLCYSNVTTYSATITHNQSGYSVVILSVAPVAVIQRASDINPAYLKPFENALAAIRHSGWFQQHVTGEKLKTVRDFIKIVNDMKTRFPGLAHLSNWHLELLCQCASLPLDGSEALPYTSTFRRLFQLLSAGLFLPGALGIIDPCEDDRDLGIHMMYSAAQQDEITKTAQYIIRLLYHRKLDQVLGAEGVGEVSVEGDFTCEGVVLQGAIPVVSN